MCAFVGASFARTKGIQRGRLRSLTAAQLRRLVARAASCGTKAAGELLPAAGSAVVVGGVDDWLRVARRRPGRARIYSRASEVDASGSAAREEESGLSVEKRAARLSRERMPTWKLLRTACKRRALRYHCAAWPPTRPVRCQCHLYLDALLAPWVAKPACRVTWRSLLAWHRRVPPARPCHLSRFHHLLVASLLRCFAYAFPVSDFQHTASFLRHSDESKRVRERRRI